MTRLIRILGNWAFILTSPLWVLPIFLICFGQALLDPNGNEATLDIITGRTWIV